ncbi:thioredoxin-disulfide reductase [Apiospora hydei]|uniref:Thioredoxin-disulfide reductase n=1 Tax=Apiospora hydei TaxID=1337664 RepID=A0ABR1W085_9PEZI
MHSKVVIIGSGPAAHTAAVYLARAELKPVLYEGFMANGIAAGGQLTTTTEVENFPVSPRESWARNSWYVAFVLRRVIEGKMLTPIVFQDNMRAQSERFGTQIISETIAKLDLSSRPFKYETEWAPGTVHTADSIILATGASARRLGLPGEEKYWQNGISACAVCDGAVPIFRNKPLFVIGGGDSAAEEATFLTKSRSASTARASRSRGDDKGLMSHIVVKNNKTGEEETLEANGLFYAIGHEPATTLVKGQLDMDSEGYIVTKAGSPLTNIEGVFAAGDVQDKRYKQAITSAGSGCMAALDAEKYLAELEIDTREEVTTNL